MKLLLIIFLSVTLARGEQCHSNQFRCGSGECISLSWKCDNIIDCSDSSDELKCSPPSIVMSAPLSGECNSYTREIWNEGYKTCKYLDSKGIPTIAVGFNLRKSSARQRVSLVGANYDRLIDGLQCLDDSQIVQLFQEDMTEAVDCAKSWIGDNWYKMTMNGQSAIADMAFNMGCGRLKGFRRLNSALKSNPPNYEKAAAEMKDSLWCKQVKSRCDRDIKCIRQ